MMMVKNKREIISLIFDEYMLFFVCAGLEGTYKFLLY